MLSVVASQLIQNFCWLEPVSEWSSLVGTPNTGITNVLPCPTMQCNSARYFYLVGVGDILVPVLVNYCCDKILDISNFKEVKGLFWLKLQREQSIMTRKA